MVDWGVYRIYIHQENATDDYYAVLIATIMMGISIIIIKIYEGLGEKAELETRNMVYQTQVEAYRVQISEREEAVKEFRLLKHDMKNHLHQIRDFVERERIMELKQYTESMLATMENDSVVCNTGNQEIDSILNFKCARWNQLNVEVHFDLNVPPELNIESFDLTKILGNLLDNVSDAIEKVEKRIVYIRIHYEKGIVNICIRNTFNGQIAVADGNLMTMKANSQKHGFGYQSIKEAVEKYNGEVEFDYTDYEQFMKMSSFAIKTTQFRHVSAQKQVLCYNLIDYKERRKLAMKNFISKYAVKFGGCIAALAMMVTAATVNSACVWFTHQEKLPEEAKKLRKF
mgnify:CR=1 FL=1